MATELTIAGVAKFVPPGGLRGSKLGATEKLTATIQDSDSSASAYRPQRGDLVRLVEDGNLQFGGPIIRVTDSRIIDDVGTQTTFEASDWTHLCDSIFVFESYPEQAAYVTWAHLVDTYLTEPYGVTWISATTGGATLPAMTFDGESLRTVIERLETMTGHFFRINGDKEAAANAKITSAIVLEAGGTSDVLFPLQWEQARERRATRVYVRLGSAGQGSIERTEDHAGDGTRVVYLLDAIPRAGEEPTTIDVHRAATTTETLGTYPADYATHEWTYAAHFAAQNARAEIIHNTALGTVLSGAHFIRVGPLSLAYPVTVRVEDEAAVDGGTIIERMFTHSDVLSIEEGLSLASGYLRNEGGEPKKAIVRLRGPEHIYPNVEVALNFSDRLLSGDWLCTETEIADIGIPWSEDHALVKTHTLIQSDYVGRSVLDFLRRVGGGSGSGGGSSSSPVTIIPAGAIVLFSLPLGGSRHTGLSASGTWEEIRERQDARVAWSKIPLDATVRARLYVSADSGTVNWRVKRVSDDAVIATDTAQTSAWPAFTERELVLTREAATTDYYVELSGSTAAPVYGIGVIDAGM